jgi:hypothetical protein
VEADIQQKNAEVIKEYVKQNMAITEIENDCYSLFNRIK